MGAASLQLQSTGATDIFLVNKPEINIFKYTYYRYVNFATDTFELNLNQDAQFGVTKVTVDIPKKGHLLSKLYLKLSLPKLNRVDGSYVCWSDTLGYSIFSKPIELEIEGIVVDRLYPVCMDMLDELSNNDKRAGINQMILKSDIYRSAMHNADQPTELLIPLDFWFTKQYNLALPLLSTTKQDIAINFYFRPFDEVINYDGNIGALNTTITNSSVYAEYIYLDDTILEQFQKQKRPLITGTKVRRVNADNLAKIKIPVPSPEEQERIVSILDKFDTLTTSISEGLPKEIELRKKQYEYYRNLLLTFPKKENA
jgi:hypothetical protein